MHPPRHSKPMLIVTLALLLAPGPGSADEADVAWAALRQDGHVALLRHASAPGTGDPPGFRLEDCATQRNLSPEGRSEAEEIGGGFRSYGVRVDVVYSSEWCRCLETAQLLDLGDVVPLPPLNSFLGQPEQEGPQMAALRAWIAEHSPRGAVVLVTHQVVVTSLTGIVPASGEIVVARPRADGRLDVIGRIPPPR